MKAPALFSTILSILVLFNMANAGHLYSYQQRFIICMLTLEYANAEELTNVLAPFLSPQGKIGAYSPTNTLIIRDQPSVVKMLIKAIKGKEDLSECLNFQNSLELNP